MPDESKQTQNGLYIKAGVLAALLLGLYFLLIYLNIVSCGYINMTVCDAYYAIVAGGKPRILIVYGQDGLGDPDSLYNVLKGPKFAAVVKEKDLSLVSLPELLQYQLVIVERAKTMKVVDLQMFEDFVNRGGKLVWIADAGTGAPPEESDANNFLTVADRKGGTDSSYISPWARKAGDKQVSFDYLLGVEYLANYCDLAQDCQQGQLVGFVNFPDTSKRPVYGLASNLAFYGDFSLVRLDNDAYQTGLGYMDYGNTLVAKPPQGYFWLKSGRTSFGKEFPMVVSSGFGDRVLYYSFPIEYVVGDNMPVDTKTGKKVAYWGIIEDMYYGMLYR